MLPGRARRRSAEAARHPPEREELLRKLDKAIEPLDVAGLRDTGRRNWHPVRAEDLLAGACKLGATREQVEDFLDQSGFFAPAAREMS